MFNCNLHVNSNNNNTVYKRLYSITVILLSAQTEDVCVLCSHLYYTEEVLHVYKEKRFTRQCQVMQVVTQLTCQRYHAGPSARQETTGWTETAVAR